MESCPLCGEAVSEERPRHRITLEIEDTTRSKQFMGDETDVKRYCVDRQVCPGCWEDYRANLTA